MTHPRLLLIDITPICGAAATSTLKQAYFGGWRDEGLLQIADAGGNRIGLAAGGGAVRPVKSNAAIAAAVQQFKPQVMLYRPVADSPVFHDCAMAAITAGRACAAGLAVWMMDDWPARLKGDDPVLYEKLDADLRKVIAEADACFAISPGMAAAFGQRYGAKFSVVRNGVDANEWPVVGCAERDVKIIRYAGSLAPDTTRDVVFDVAHAVSDLSSRGEPVRFEGRTQAHWMSVEGKQLNALRGVAFSESTMTPQEYRRWLTEADLLLVAYNFDSNTRAYLQYSFANKLPETMAAGAAILAYGPHDIETMSYLAQSGAANMVHEKAGLQSAILDLVQDREKRAALGSAAREHAFTHFNLASSRKYFHGALSRISAVGPAMEIEGDVGEQLQFDECGFVYEIVDASEQSGLMLDVGAHVGGSLLPFAKAGWRVHAFEPDARNREQLLAATKGMDRVRVNSQAVGAKPAANVPFFRSDVSSGISGLSAFHESHQRAGGVDVIALSQYLAAANINDVDFLKIDVEGHEMSVLDGFDLEAVRPRAIVAEFEDAKTRAHGYSMVDLAERFTAAGYAVFVSEWRPVERYGVQHRWRRLLQYPAETALDSWGNLIALRDPPDTDKMQEAFAASLSGGRAGAAAPSLVSNFARPPSVYRRLADALARRAPGVAGVLRPAVQALRKRRARVG